MEWHDNHRWAYATVAVLEGPSAGRRIIWTQLSGQGSHSAPYGRGFDWQAAATPGDEQLKIDVFV